MKPTCYLDMDGVLVDFVSGALRAHGRAIYPKKVRYEFPVDLGFKSPHDPAFWNPLGREFWSSLDWTGEGKELLAGLELIFGERIVLVTSPPLLPLGAVDGKEQWVQRNLPAYMDRLVITRAKYLMAGPAKLLVDDNNDNIVQHYAGGGRVVMVPRPWNARRHQTDDEGRFSVDAIIAEARQAEEWMR